MVPSRAKVGPRKQEVALHRVGKGWDLPKHEYRQEGCAAVVQRGGNL